MPNYYSPDTIQAMLDKAKEIKKQQNGYQAPQYQQFAPKQMKTDYETDPLYGQLQNSILDRTRVATETQLIKDKNLADFRALQEARRRRRQANQQANNWPTTFPGDPNAPGGSVNVGGSWNDPDGVSGIGVGQNLRTINWRGHSLTLNKTAVNNFVGFLNALWKTGYRPKVIGSYANRNIAGTDRKSLHAYGLAIDIDPSRNPVTYNGVPITVLPAGVAALAAKYGLAWGGAWNGSKTDSMHFSIPYGGTK